jgi:uncharacterized protein YdeI (BOF family)
MKKILFIIALISGISIWFAVYGCAKKPQIYGSQLTQTKVTAVTEILKQPDQFAGKAVRLEGKIVQECPAGGWFMLQDDTGVILIDLHPSEISIPQAVGRSVAAQGKVKKEYNQISVIGEGVEFK